MKFIIKKEHKIVNVASSYLINIIVTQLLCMMTLAYVSLDQWKMSCNHNNYFINIYIYSYIFKLVRTSSYTFTLCLLDGNDAKNISLIFRNKIKNEINLSKYEFNFVGWIYYVFLIVSGEFLSCFLSFPGVVSSLTLTFNHY